MKKLVLGLIVVALAGAGAWLVFTPKQNAPAVTFETLNEQNISMESLRGKVVLVKFWATSCVTCVQQMPDTIELYDALSPKGLEVIAVAMSYDPIQFVKQFAASRNLPFHVAPDKSNAIAKAFDDVRLTPIAFLIDKQGKIVKRYLGVYDKRDLRLAVEKALAG
jgi:peroxiredoxin